jgi:hypothetical protein
MFKENPMIFEQLGKHKGNLIAYKWDFGVPVTFATVDDDIPFTVGDKILFELNSTPKIKKQFTVDTDDFSFDLGFTKEEADRLADSNKNAFVFSFKQYSETGVFFQTIMNGKLILKETLQWAE